jgi:hypothetical protein
VFPGKSEIWIIEVKRALSAKPKKGFYHACEDLQPHKSIVVYADDKRYTISEGVYATGLPELCQMITKERYLPPPFCCELLAVKVTKLPIKRY